MPFALVVFAICDIVVLPQAVFDHLSVLVFCCRTRQNLLNKMTCWRAEGLKRSGGVGGGAVPTRSLMPNCVVPVTFVPLFTCCYVQRV